MYRRILFAFCYIPPSDFQYYSLNFFSLIKENFISRFMPSGYVIVGDINARFGISARDLLILCEVSDNGGWSYPDTNDDVSAPNDNAQLFICFMYGQFLFCDKQPPGSR